jgi:hypothetical protein
MTRKDLSSLTVRATPHSNRVTGHQEKEKTQGKPWGTEEKKSPFDRLRVTRGVLIIKRNRQGVLPPTKTAQHVLQQHNTFFTLSQSKSLHKLPLSDFSLKFTPQSRILWTDSAHSKLKTGRG